MQYIVLNSYIHVNTIYIRIIYLVVYVYNIIIQAITQKLQIIHLKFNYRTQIVLHHFRSTQLLSTNNNYIQNTSL